MVRPICLPEVIGEQKQKNGKESSFIMTMRAHIDQTKAFDGAERSNCGHPPYSPDSVQFDSSYSHIKNKLHG
ncbi:hypothetical protein NPIL_696841 [Nephila pilipes]|uniref:Uncharacterized protein n=1 Tax=Nephila pilipes TaxID=299642 RepID=A0A8X6U4X3_NEPPI|nr:hypothetical protein NPIL_696841 [Nephila pilipes]